MKRTRGFTLIELLTVIAIIAVLSAIILPVYARAKDSANRSSDITSMNSLRTALQLYRVDQGGYPPALLGYVTLYESGPNVGNVIPADKLSGFLYPKRVDSVETFRPIPNRTQPADITQAVWPDADARPVNANPVLDLNGDGKIDNADDTRGARQYNDPGTNPQVTVKDASNNDVPLQYYKVSGYDTAEVRVGNVLRRELRYSLFWTQFGVSGGSAVDDPRQLGYQEPPENTVVTWNSYYREYDGGNTLQRSKRDLVLFLGGGARPYDSVNMRDRSWRSLP